MESACFALNILTRLLANAFKNLYNNVDIYSYRKRSTMLKNLSRILGITGGVLSLLESMFLTVVLPFAASPPGSVSHNSQIDYSTYGFLTGVLLIFISAVGLAGSFNVREKPVIAGAVMIISGSLMLVFDIITNLQSVVILLGIPFLLLIAAGVIALVHKSDDAVSNTAPEPPASEQ